MSIAPLLVLLPLLLAGCGKPPAYVVTKLGPCEEIRDPDGAAKGRLLRAGVTVIHLDGAAPRRRPAFARAGGPGL